MSGTPPDVAWTSDIEEVVITVPKPTSSTSNKWDNLLNTMSNVTDIANKAIGKSKQDESFLAKMTKGTVIETGLDNSTKMYLGVLVAGIVALFYFKK